MVALSDLFQKVFKRREEVKPPPEVALEPPAVECQHPRKVDVTDMGGGREWLCPDCGALLREK